MARATATPVAQTFAQLITATPHSARQPAASGVLPPILRSMAHVLYLAVNLSDETATVPDDVALGELDHAIEHWNVIATTGLLSTAGTASLTQFGLLLAAARAEYTGWGDQANSEEDRGTLRARHINDLANRAIGLTVVLDRELLGLRGSDAGSSL